MLFHILYKYLFGLYIIMYFYISAFGSGECVSGRYESVRSENCEKVAVRVRGESESVAWAAREKERSGERESGGKGSGG